MKIELDIENLKTRIESVLYEQRLIDEGEHIDIKSSNRYFNFWYGIVKLKETQLYGFSLNLDDEDENPIVYRIFGNIKSVYGEKEIDNDKKEYLVYERLSPGDTLIISRQGDSFMVAENEDGELHIRNIKVEEDNGNRN